MLFNRNKPVTPAPAASEPVKVDPPPSDPPVEAAPPAEYVPKADFDKLQASIYELQSNVTNFFARQNQPQQTAPVTPQIVIEDVTDDEYADAIAGSISDKHKAAAIVQKRHTAIAKRESVQLQQKIDQLQSVGMGAISNLTAQSLVSKPHYKTYKKEIDAAISQLPPEARVNAQALEGVYNYILGSHIEEIMASERETVLRQAAVKPDTPAPSGRGSSPAGGATGATPLPSEALDPLALAAIRDKYGSTGPEAIDRFVRSQGQKTWDEYYTKFLKPFEETQGNA